jgi:diamine N-acetyltransferase
MTHVLRRATPADVEALSLIGKETFTETFGHLYPPEDLEAYLPPAYGVERMARDLANPDKAAWLFEENGRPIGYAQAGPCDLPHPEVTPACGELKRIYLRKSHQGTGAGSRLLHEVLGWLDRPGRRLWIGVWSENHGAQRLYARHGFKQVGEYEFPVGKIRDRELILARG